MPFRLHELIPPGQVAHHWYPGGRLDLGLAELQVPGTSHSVEDHAGNSQVGVKLLVAQDFRRDAPGHLGGVCDQDDRGPQQFCQLRCGSLFIQAGMSVEYPHDPFDDGNVAPGTGPLEQFGHRGMGQHPCVQVARGCPAGQRVIRRVNVVWSRLERLHPVSQPGQCSHDAGGDRRLANAAPYPGDNHRRRHGAFSPERAAGQSNEV